MSKLAERLIDEATGGVDRMAGSDFDPWHERKKKPKWKGGKPELERFGLAGLPGGTADWGVEPGYARTHKLNRS